MLQECLNYIERNGPDIAVQILDHMKISLAALLIAVLIGVAGGYAASVSRRGEKWIMGLFQILRVIPSLAILVLLIPLMGVGMKPAVTALAILAIPPILTNTCVGFMEVPTFMVESAKGMGMTDREMLVHVKFPLALPMIMAGSRRTWRDHIYRTGTQPGGSAADRRISCWSTFTDKPWDLQPDPQDADAI